MLMKNSDFLKVMDQDDVLDEFISILELLTSFSYKVNLMEEDLLDDIYYYIHMNMKKNEDIRIINSKLEKMFSFENPLDFIAKEQKLEDLIKEEETNLKKILTHETNFKLEESLIKYSLASCEAIRVINDESSLKNVMLIFSSIKPTPQQLMEDLDKVFSNIIFDEDILESIDSLNDGFSSRREEIIYHLFCIDSEVPIITSRGIRHYREIGEALSIDCSPERSRLTVQQKLTKKIGEQKLNCELHTKMKTVSSKAPDRIYFCPYVPEDFDEEYRGKIFVYKISKHV